MVNPTTMCGSVEGCRKSYGLTVPVNCYVLSHQEEGRFGRRGLIGRRHPRSPRNDGGAGTCGLGERRGWLPLSKGPGSPFVLF